jgi:hypothetical protein
MFLRGSHCATPWTLPHCRAQPGVNLPQPRRSDVVPSDRRRRVDRDDCLSRIALAGGLPTWLRARGDCAGRSAPARCSSAAYPVSPLLKARPARRSRNGTRTERVLDRNLSVCITDQRKLR